MVSFHQEHSVAVEQSLFALKIPQHTHFIIHLILNHWPLDR